MKNSNDIWNELKELSPVLAGMEKVNVFTVPEGYFERLVDDILMSLKKEEGDLVNRFTKISTLQVPQGYFESLADNILNTIKTQESTTEELRDLSPLLHGVQNKNVFTVPQGYFESMSDAVLNKINTEESALEELKELSPILYSIQNENVFTVPQDYFESVPGEILHMVAPRQAKVVIMHRRTVTLFKYAAAAVFTGVMALGVFKFVAVQSKTILPDYVNAGLKIKNVDEELSKLTDDDIIKYLQVDGSDVDAALVANTIDENELPTQDDYLTDDKALDNYLDNINLSDLKN